MTVEAIKLSKLDVARRQLETAVRLFFSEEDPVSIHTLLAAAYKVLRDLNHKRAGDPMLKDTMLDWVRPDARQELKERLCESENFFKHADRDAAEVLYFNPQQGELFLFDACQKYRQLSGEVLPVLAVYQVWFHVGPWGELVSPEYAGYRDEVRRTYPNETRQSFFSRMLPVMSKTDPRSA